MSAVEERLAELGLTVPEVVPPVAAYVPVVRDGNLVFTSGQLPMVDGSLAATIPPALVRRALSCLSMARSTWRRSTPWDCA